MKVQHTDDYLPGNFLKNENIISLTFDYNIINNLKAWNILKKNNNTLKNNLKLQMYPEHSDESLEKSFRIMEFIAKNGWEDYVFLIRD